MTKTNAGIRSIADFYGGLERTLNCCTILDMDQLRNDIRYGFRMLTHNPGFTLVAVVTLALGIGANTTIFSVINSTLLKPLPYPDSGRLMALFEADANNFNSKNEASAPNFEDWRRQNSVFAEMALLDAGDYDLASPGQDPQRTQGSRVSAGFFNALGVQPFLGRGFEPGEEQTGRNHEVVLGYGLWAQRYNSDKALIGQAIKLNGEPYTVVGVMPQSFQFQFFTRPLQLYVPVGYTQGDRERGNHSFLVFGRLKPGITYARAHTEMNAIGLRLAKEYPADNSGRTVATEPLEEVGLEDLRSTLLALVAAVGFVLLIACVNVANLMLSRGAARQKEFAMRCALGAGRGRLIRQLMTESVLLAVLGGTAGVFLALWTTGMLIRVLPAGLRFVPFRSMDSIAIDGRVLLFAFAVSCLTGVLFGLSPALGAFRTDVNDLLKQRGRSGANERSNRLRYLLVASEVALTMVVLTCAGLMIGSMSRLMSVNPGFDPKNVLTMTISSAQVDLYNGPPSRPRFCLDLEERVATLPGVTSVSSVAQLPLQGGAARSFVIEGRPDPGDNPPGGGYDVACPGYLRTMRIPLLAGRDFTNRDAEGTPNVALISQAMARLYWKNEDPIGKRFKILPVRPGTPWLTIVGVYGDVRTRGLDQNPRPVFFRPFMQAGWPRMTIVVRTASTPAALIDPVRKALAQTDPDRAASEPETLDEVIGDSVGSRRFPMFILGTLAALALALAAVGIAGVVAYSVAQRTNEIGIRMALGASGGDVLKLVVGRSMRWAIGGVVPGVAVSLLVTRLISGLLYNVRPTDPLILGTVAGLLTAVALLASYLPARRATKVDPMVALHYE